MHLTGLHWDNATHTPALIYRARADVGELMRWELVRGEQIHLTISTEILCIGSFGPPGCERIPCPRAVRLTGEGRVQCPACRGRDAALFLPLTILSEEQRARVKAQPHLTYLNLFGGELVKVGVAVHTRKYTRVHEQGAHATLFISASDGIAAREIEDVLSRRLALPQVVRVSTKLQVLSQIPDMTHAHARLMQVYAAVAKNLSPHHVRHLLTPPEYLYNIPLYQLPQGRELWHLTPGDTTYEVGGVVESIVGELLILTDTSGKHIVVNIKDLLGRIVTIDKKLSSVAIPQSSYKKLTTAEDETPGLFS